jgi:N-methylhydantoinase A
MRSSAKSVGEHLPHANGAPQRWRAGVDIGGTFTDLLLVDRDAGELRVDKVLTAQDDPARAVTDALRGQLENARNGSGVLENVVHGTTLVTNAIVERKGPRTALIVTRGFRDILEIAREHRYDMYDIHLRRPDPLVPRRLVFGVTERVLADGSIHVPLDERDVEDVASNLWELGVRAVAVCLLHAYATPAHELRVREILLAEEPRLRVSVSHEIVAEHREYERALSTIANAFVLEMVDAYLTKLEDGMHDLGLVGDLLVMMSNAAVSTADTAKSSPVRMIESGPAAGALAAAHLGGKIERLDMLAFDMGGTTAKACIIRDGRPTISNELEVARISRFHPGSGLPLKIGSVDLIEIGAGGGSIARLDALGPIKVGPASAGSRPGPASYGFGGSQPTVTDADLVLGYLDPGYFLGGRMRLDLEAARTAISEQLAAPLALEIDDAAWTVHQIVNENMANAARVHAAEHGVDPATLPIFAFGGAGPVHAYRVAEKLGVTEVIVPFGAGVGSTFGLLAAPLATDVVRTSPTLLSAVDWSRISGLLEDLEARCRGVLRRAGIADADMSVRRAADMRLVGQAHELAIPIPDPTPGAGDEPRLAGLFASAYGRRFRRPPPAAPIEIINWRVRVEGPEPGLPIARPGPSRRRASTAVDARKGHRPAYLVELGGWHDTPVFDRYRLMPGARLEGPAIIEERETTVVVGPAARVDVDEAFNLHMVRH